MIEDFPGPLDNSTDEATRSRLAWAGGPAFSAAVVDDQVVTSHENEVSGIDLASGQVNWTWNRSTNTPLLGSELHVVGGGRVGLLESLPDMNLLTVLEPNGAVAWTRSLSSPAAVAGTGEGIVVFERGSAEVLDTDVDIAVAPVMLSRSDECEAPWMTIALPSPRMSS